jgi:hypothetical protein
MIITFDMFKLKKNNINANGTTTKKADNTSTS